MRVWVTREEPSNGPLCTALHQCGLSPVLEPVIEKHLVASPAELMRDLGRDDWLVLTSPFAVQALGACPAARVPRVAVVGRPSAAAALSLGLRVELVSPDEHGAGLFEALRERAVGARVCYPRSSLARVPELGPGMRIDAPVLYETRERDYDRTVVGRVDVAALASPSAVRAVGPVDLPFASIGRATSAEIRRLGRQPWVEAATPSFVALAQAIAAQSNPSRHQRA